MADVIQNPFLLYGFNSTEVEGSHHLPCFATITHKDAVDVENRWIYTGLQAVEKNHLTSLGSTDHHRVAWKDPSSVSFGALRRTCIDGRDLREALQQADRLAQEGFGIPNDILVQLIQRCSDEHDVASGRKTHHIVKKCHSDLDAFIGSHLIRMFGVLGCLEEAVEVFATISQPNVFAWGAIISAHVNLGYSERAIYTYTKMQGSGVKPDGHIFVTVLKACMDIGKLEQSLWIHLDIVEGGFETEVFVGSTLIDMYAKCGDLETACQIFNKLPERNVVTWSLLIEGHSQLGHSDLAVALFEQMKAGGIEPNPATYASVVKACSHLQDGRQIHAHVIECG